MSSPAQGRGSEGAARGAAVMPKHHTCAATDALSSRGALRTKGRCLWNRVKAHGTAKDNLVQCGGCRTLTCRACIKKLRLQARRVIKLNKHLAVINTDQLDWLVRDRARVDDMFDEKAAANAGVLRRINGQLCFATKCMFCYDVALPQRLGPLTRIPPALSYPIVQPSFARREIHIFRVSSARTLACSLACASAIACSSVRHVSLGRCRRSR